MDILPAIDLRDGKVVRLAQGDYDRQTRYSDDPAAVARAFVAAGAGWIHVVDLDAARLGASQAANAAALEAILAAAGSAKIEFGGGMRDTQAIQAVLARGVGRVVVGSAAVKDWRWFEELLETEGLAPKLALGLDARDGKLAVHGWTRQVDLTPLDLALRVKGSALGAIVYTDIARDGMLVGPNVEATAELVASTDVPVIASGGVGSAADIGRCADVGCAGVIVGRAYYEGKIDLAAALAAVKKGFDLRTRTL